MCISTPHGLEEGAGSPGTGVKDGCEPPYGSLKLRTKAGWVLSRSEIALKGS